MQIARFLGVVRTVIFQDINYLYTLEFEKNTDYRYGHEKKRLLENVQ